MKKYFILVALGVAMCFSSLVAKQQTKIGAGLAYGTDVEKIAIQACADIAINAPITIAPDFKYYLTDEFVTFWELNANVHYVVSDKGGTNIYLLGGLNYATSSVDMAFLGSVSSSEIGLNVGAGIDLSVGSFYITPEVKYVLSSFDQLVIGAALMFPL
jgi:outer membrane protein X